MTRDRGCVEQCSGNIAKARGMAEVGEFPRRISIVDIIRGARIDSARFYAA